jgi:hypothetical protein
VPRHGADVLRVDQRDGPAFILQDVEDGPPVHARRFRGDLRDPDLLEPIREGQQVGGHRPKGLGPPLDCAVGLGEQDTRDDRLLVDVEPAAPLVEHPHRALLAYRPHRSWSG